MDFGHQIRMTFGTSHYEPTHDQQQKIANDFLSAYRQGKLNSRQDCFEIVKRHCPSAGKYFYKGLDNSDLNILLQFAINTIKETN
ncbi:hypothetical protein ACJJIW_12450 [Microbulbifer sp. JMSA004]|uniref:hypothetical protein n=1 Tax=Microbulbifer sp. JMSA004 TaxID=3243370 RepID=UPI004039BC08